MKHYRKLTLPYLVWCIIFILIPLVLIVLYAFTTIANPVISINFTLSNFAKINDPTYIRVFIKSFELGVITTLICFAAGYPFAYVISRQSDSVQDMLILLVTIPTWINMLLRTYAWMNILADNGIINGLLHLLGMNPVTMMYTNFSDLVGMVCNCMPFMIIPIHTSLRKMDGSLLEAAMDLGANRWQTFLQVTFRLSVPGVINGVVMVFLMAISAFVIPKLLGGGQFVLIGNLIESQFISIGDWNFGSAISTILAVIILIAMRLMKSMDLKEAEAN
jgi:spermidine/putrescine transport system permease protein